MVRVLEGKVCIVAVLVAELWQFVGIKKTIYKRRVGDTVWRGGLNEGDCAAATRLFETIHRVYKPGVSRNWVV